MNIPELLAPAGNFERLCTALRFGADAVYLGMRRMSLRNFAENFSMDELHEACAMAHSCEKRIYVTVNAFARNAALKELPAFLRDLQVAGTDALIINDPGVLTLAREAVPEMNLHLSTQANTLNSAAAAFWHAQGIKRIVLARELSLQEIREIQMDTPEALELEIFIHGAMCVSYSGRCLLSNYLNGRDSNHGECAQPCRWTYELRERGTDGAYFPIEQDGLGTYILNSRDLNLMPHLHEVCRLGVSSLKIEGRMKSIYYVAGVVNAYRMALDRLAALPEDSGFHGPWNDLLQELEKVSHRPFTSGFAFGDPASEGQAAHSAQYLQSHELSARVLAYDAGAERVLVEQRNRFFEGDELELLAPGEINKAVYVAYIETEDGLRIQHAPHPKQKLWLPSTVAMQPGDLLRKKLI